MGFIRESSVDIQQHSLFVAQAGQEGDPLLILLHGFPETWASWRYQMPVLAEAGYHVIAPELRGYGESWSPSGVEHYSMLSLAEDIVGLMDHFGQARAVLVGHDFGCALAWQVARLYPERVRALGALSVPYGGQPPVQPTQAMKQKFGDHFFYMLYFQQAELPERELSADIRDALNRIYYSGSAAGQQAGAEGFVATSHTSPGGGQGRGFLAGMPLPTQQPDWLRSIDLDYYVSRFEKSGFTGPLNWYRAMDLYWEQTREDDQWRIRCPVVFIAGKDDGVIKLNRKALERMPELLDDLRGVYLLENCGHWTQMEKPSEVSGVLLEFLNKLDGENESGEKL